MFSMSYRLFLAAIGLMMLATWLAAWWTVPIVGAVYGYVARTDPFVPLRAAIAGFVAWSVLLIAQAPGGGITRIADAVGGVIGIGALGVTALTLLFAALLAGSAAALVRALTAPKAA